VKAVVVGLGVQGYKRRQHAGSDYVASVDPVNMEAEYRDLRDVPLDRYDAVLACVPDQPKADLLRYALGHGKHVLVEKPLWVENDSEIRELAQLARNRNVVCYTAYNHRFEPHFVRMRDLIASGELGTIYSCRMFYGNGTARLVRDSRWRDEGAGVLPDLGSHLLDTCRFWFGPELGEFRVTACNRFENRAPDHVIISAEQGRPRIELEMTLCMWRNHFTCDVLAERGTAHIESLCKWGPSTFTTRLRVLPSGRPPEHQVTLVQSDPTWEAEYRHFKQLVSAGSQTDLETDAWLQTSLRRLSEGVLQ
jgi:scyllo-inositol 2-dehydrogenase (NADP+)